MDRYCGHERKSETYRGSGTRSWRQEVRRKLNPSPTSQCITHHWAANPVPTWASNRRIYATVSSTFCVTALVGRNWKFVRAYKHVRLDSMGSGGEGRRGFLINLVIQLHNFTFMLRGLITRVREAEYGRECVIAKGTC